MVLSRLQFSTFFVRQVRDSKTFFPNFCRAGGKILAA
jgi:hypothetical protein